MTSPILIESSDGSKDLINHPPLDTIANLASFPSGDVAINGNGPNGPVSVGIELKTISDLMTSSITGRLTTQLERMVTTYHRVWILTYGTLATNPASHLLATNVRGRLVPVMRGTTTPFQFTEYYSLLHEISECNVHHHHVPDYPSAALWIAHTAKFWAKPYRCHDRLATLELPTTTLIPRYAAGDDENDRMKITMRMAACLPHISKGRALTIAQHFASIRDMLTATVAQWVNIPGIGDTTATTAVELINRKRP